MVVDEMGSPKVRNPKYPQNQFPNWKQLSRSQLIQNFISAIQAPQGLKPSLLKRLYYLLVHLSSNHPICCPRGGADSTFWEISFGQCRIMVSFEDICRLSDVLYKQLSKMFNQFFSSWALRQATLHLDIPAASELLNLLLRCCLVMLNLLIPDQLRLLENGRVLHAILGELCSLNLNEEKEVDTIDFEKVSREYTYDDNYCTTSFTEDIVASLHFMEPVNPCLPFLCALLEVFADELLVHGQLREYFKLIDSLSSTSGKLFMCHSSHRDIGSVMEVISSHFCLSFSDKQAFENFLSGLISLNGKNYRAPELSPTSSLVLLLNPSMLSAPKFLHAHLILLVSEAMTIGKSLENIRPDVRLMDCYLSAFERSVILYVNLMSTLRMNDCPKYNEDYLLKFNEYGGKSQPSFESYIQPVTREKIHKVISKLDNSWQSQLHDMFLRMKYDLAISSIAYIKDKKHTLDQSFSDEIISILSCIILKAFSSEVGGTSLHASGDKSPQDIYLLASILKLMSCSLSQSIWCLRHNGDLGCLKTLKDLFSCKEYDSIVGIISCFRQFNLSLPIQKSSCDIIETHPTKHKESKLMLLHFLGLLSLSFSTGLDFLVRGCISTMMSLMNLFVFEEGNLDALRFDYGSESFPSGLHPDNVLEAVVDKKSSLVVATKFQKIQTLYLSAPSPTNDPVGCENRQEETLTSSSIPSNMRCVVGMEEETEETCNGKIFLKCRLGKRAKYLSDFGVLSDFIECKKGKNYSGWLKDRQRYRKWKGERMAVLRWKRKKKIWKFMKGKRS